MKLETPYYSQLLDVKDKEWQSRSCGIVCLKMAFDFLSPNSTPSVDELIKEGLYIGGHGPQGWIHDSLVILAHNHGFNSYKQEFKSLKVDIENKKTDEGEFQEKFLNDGVLKIKNSIKENTPVLVSIIRQGRPDSHMVLVVGFEENKGELSGFNYYDPNSLNKEEGANKFFTIEDFKNNWRRLAIFVGK
ncbi:MAG: C39 family peptidase [Candidatus Paceibacterota bacterium]